MNKKKCIKCGEKFNYEQEETFWDEKGSESVKLVRCKECDCIQPIRYEKMNNPNTDIRYFLMLRK